MNNNGVKTYAEGAANDSVQYRAEGTEPMLGWGWYSFPFRLGIPNVLEMPDWGTPERDRFLRATLHGSSLFSGVVFGEASRVKNADYFLTSETRSPEDLRRYQDMLQTCDFGRGFDEFRTKITTDWLTQDNGIFIELIGKNGDRRHEVPLTGDIESFAYMDAAQCYRTFSPEFPVIYTNPYTGKYYIMHWTRVAFASAFTQGFELGRGMGLCALSRAYEAGRLQLATNTYVYEKVTGASPDVYVSNIPFKSLQNAALGAMLQGDNRNLSVYRDPIVLAPLSGGVGASELNLDKISLKSMPDGFGRKEEFELAAYMVATAFGIDIREILPASVSGATRADAEVQDAKSQTKGLADLLTTLQNIINWRILPRDVTFEFRLPNPLGDKREAENRQIRAETRAVQIASGELTVEEARQLAAEAGDIDPKFLVMQTTTSDVEAVEEAPDPADDTFTAGEKSYNSEIRIPFQNALLNVLQDGNNPFMQAGQITDLYIDFGRAAYLKGINDGGAVGIVSVNQLEPEERSELNGLLSVSTDRALSLALDAQNLTLEQQQQRVLLWANKGLDTLYNAGMLSGNLNANMLWEIGKTEKHCDDCLKYNGRVYRAKTWKRYGIQPRSDKLSCKGFQCDCQLRRTNLPVMRGRPPSPSGARVKAFLSKHSSLYNYYANRH